MDPTWIFYLMVGLLLSATIFIMIYFIGCINGSYYVLQPDGRVMTVSYYIDNLLFLGRIDDGSYSVLQPDGRLMTVSYYIKKDTFS